MRKLGFLVFLLPVTLSAGTVVLNGNTYTYLGHPRVFLDGPSGETTLLLKDPDGAGPLVSPQANAAHADFAALRARVDGGNGTAYGLALDWYMDNSKAISLAAAIAAINTVEATTATGWNTPGFGVDYGAPYGGGWTDWPSLDLPGWALAYELVQDQLSDAEKTAFAQKILNDLAVSVSYPNDTCHNQLNPIVATGVNYTTGSTTVTGSGFSALTAGRKVYIRSAARVYGGLATLQTINSDSQITLAAPPTNYLGSGIGSFTGGGLWEVTPWDTTTCGFAFMLKGHDYNPAIEIGHRVSTLLTENVDLTETEIDVVDASIFPASFPYDIAVYNEVVTLTGRAGNTLTVTRNATPLIASSYKPVIFSRYSGSVTYEYGNNLLSTKLGGYIPIAVALLDVPGAPERELARVLLEESTNAYVKVVTQNKEMWTGLQQSGSSSYGPWRQIVRNVFSVVPLSKLDGSPSFDYTGGNWIKNQVYCYIYGGLPGSPRYGVPWGQTDIAEPPTDYGQHIWSMFLPRLYPASDEAKLWNYWQRTTTGSYTSANLRTGTGPRLIEWSLLYQKEADGTTDIATLPTQYAFNTVDAAVKTKALDAWISRTGWASTSDTLIFTGAWSLAYTQDHIGLGVPGGYKIYKNGWTVGENGTKNTGDKSNTNMILFAGVDNLNGVWTHTVDLDKNDAGTGWAFARVNAQAAYKSTAAVTRALRYLVHFKKAASPDYLVVYDDAATSSAKAIGQNLHYDKLAASALTRALPDIIWTGTANRVSSKLVLPSGTGVAATSTTLTDAHREYVCASADGSTCANVTAAEFLVVHRPSTSTSDTMPTVAALGTIDANYVGVQIEGAAPSIAVFPKAGLYHASTSFTSTHSDTAQYVVTGLESGIYDVVRGVTTIVDDETLDANGTIAFESVAGAFTITRAGEVPAITVTTTTLSNAVQNQPYSATLAYTGGTPPVAWNVSAGALCTGLSLSAAGAFSGTPTIAETCNFTARVLDDASAEDTQVLALTVQTPPPTLTVSASPGSTTATIQFGTPTLDEAQSCNVTVSSAAIDPGTGNPVGPVASAISSGGPSTRTVTVSGLAVSTSHTANIACGTVASGSTTFVTLAAPTGGTVSWTYTVKPHARLVARSVAKVSVEYNLVGESADTETASCATGCTLTLPLLSGQVYEIRHIWKTAADATVATSRAGLVAVP